MTFIYFMLTLLLLKVGWNFFKIYFILWYLLRHKKIYPHGVDVYLFVEWILVFILLSSMLLIPNIDLPVSWTLFFCISIILLSYLNGFFVLKIMKYIDERLNNAN